MILALLLSGCSYSPEVTLLLGPKRIEGETDIGLTMSVIQRFGEHGACGYVHVSDPQHGQPFNDEPELTVDTGGCGGRWGGNR